MAENGTVIQRGGQFEAPAISFLEVMALEVDVALKHAGITDVEKRRTVVDSFCFGMGNFLDQYWLRGGTKRYFPIISFSEQHAQDEPREAGMPENFDYHDYAHGMFDAITDNGKDLYTIEIGLYGHTEPMDQKEF